MRALLVLCLVACGAAPEAPAAADPGDASPDAAAGPTASVTALRVTGSPGAYTFAVTVASDETGCERYADWWEVVREDGSLAYRRILAHSHPSEQPFTRSGGPVPVAADETVVVRAHLRPEGVDAPGVYRGATLRGSVAAGFAPFDAPPSFGAALETAAPQPNGCAF
ncbi:MAG: hypothetical protein AAGH15_11850 [Myxococcota bacterium]